MTRGNNHKGQPRLTIDSIYLPKVYSAPEQESQLLKLFIESFLSSKKVWNTYHLLF